MTRVAGDERGFSLIELLVAMTLMIIVLGATLTTLDSAGKLRTRQEQQNDAQDLARQALDSLARQIRNLASPTTAAGTIDTASDYELIFQTTDPTKRWVRYCLATATAQGVAASASNEALWYQTPTSAFVAANISPTAAMKASCPVAPVADSSQGWLTAKVVAQHVTNQIGGQDRALFTYNAPVSTLAKITNIYTELFVDADSTRLPGEVRISTGDYLRNQNEAPTAAIAVSGALHQRSWVFNGTSSDDPEGRTLTYLWYKTTAATPDTSTLPNCDTQTIASGWECIGAGPVLNYTFPTTDTGTQKVYLKVTDPGALSGFANTGTQVVVT